MERNLVKVLVSVAILFAVTAMVSAPAWAGGNEHPGSSTSAESAKEACKMDKVKAACGEKLGKLSAALKAAQTAIDAGDTKTASAKIAWAQEQLGKMKKFASQKCKAPKAEKGHHGKSADKAEKGHHGESADKAGFINSTCPIMGSKIDPAKITKSLTREFDGKKVALCCGGCPGQWDKLSDADKKAKLKAAM